MATGTYIFGLLIILCSSQTIVSQMNTACAGVTNGFFVRNSNSCRSYYYCQDGEAHPNECPENYVFEPIRQICQIPSLVECTGCSPYGLQHIAHPIDCSSYYLCVAGIRTLNKCGENLLFDKSIGDCNAASAVKCEKDYTQICKEFGGYVKIGDPDDCSKYFSCLYGVPYHQSCAPGLYFKPAISSCTFPEEDDFCQGNGTVALSSNNESDRQIVLNDPIDLPSNNEIEDSTDTSKNNDSGYPIDPNSNGSDDSTDLFNSKESDDPIDSDNHSNDLTDLSSSSESHDPIDNDNHSNESIDLSSSNEIIDPEDSDNVSNDLIDLPNSNESLESMDHHNYGSDEPTYVLNSNESDESIPLSNDNDGDDDIVIPRNPYSDNDTRQTDEIDE